MGVNMHPELERLERDFAWTPNLVAAWDSRLNIWLASGQQLDKSVYDDQTWEKMGALLDNSWWSRTRNSIIHSTIHKSGINKVTWDVGSGTGFEARYLSAKGLPTIGVEPSHAGAVAGARRGVLSFCASLEQLQLPNSSLENVSMLDVLEHLDNRENLLAEVHRLLTSDGRLVLTVPALTSLWSQFDVDLGHYLRYNKRSIKKELESNGFEVIRMGYFFALTVLPLFVLRALPHRLGVRKAVGTEATLGASGGILGRVATWIERAIAMKTPIGSSLLVVARKR
jgi:SAM-dependent methyltransferase